MNRRSISLAAVLIFATLGGEFDRLLTADPVPAGSDAAASAPAPRRPGGRGARSEEPRERLVIQLNYTPAQDLAKTLSNHFQGAGAEVRIIADTLSNSLLITAPNAELDEIRQIVQVLDRRPKSVVVEATLIECPAPADAAAPLKAFDERDWNGPAAEVAAKIEAAVKEGRVKNVRKLRLRTINNQLSQVHSNDGQANPAAGERPGPARPGMRQIAPRSGGTTLSVTPRIADDDQIVMELSILDSRPRTQRELEKLLENSAVGQAPDMSIFSEVALSTRAMTTVTIHSGEAILVQAGATNSMSQPSQVAIIVSAEVVK